VIPPTSSVAVDDGYYIANFLTAMPDSSFVVLGTGSESGNFSANSGVHTLSGSPYNAQSARVLTIDPANDTGYPLLVNSVSFLR